MKTIKLFLISFIVTVILGTIIIDHAFSAVPIETSVSNRLNGVRGYSIPSIPVIWADNLDADIGGLYYGDHIELNSVLLGIYGNYIKSLVITHEYLHYYSREEGLVEAVTEDEIHRWYRKSWPELDWSTYGKQVSMWRWISSNECKCPWPSSAAQLLRKTYLLERRI